ncbi:MAG: BtrH N-terminal domain-containing protein [Thermodesulfobacteriota bacterium]
MQIDFKHRQSAHCESGVSSNLLFHYGLDISEAMAFGIGAGLFFGYLPFIRINQLPLTTFRCEVGGILKRLTRKLGVKIHLEKFRNPEKAMAALDRGLENGIPMGCRTGAYWLPYFPSAYRFHFNMHNLVVYGKEGDDYLISDPVFPEIQRCSRPDLMKARFAKGALAPRGTMYYLTHVPGDIDLRDPIRQGIQAVCHRMLKVPGPIIGVRGIRFLAGQVEKWPRKLGKRKAALYLGQLVRMQEELGTGGAGFRFMYAAFLQESAGILNKNRLLGLSDQMTQAGDLWRRFAVLGARNCKDRAAESDSFVSMADILRECARKESEIYQELLAAVQ